MQINDLITTAMGHHAAARFTEAQECYQQIIALAPAWPEVHNNLGCVLQAQGKLDEAAESYRRAVALKPDYAVAHHNLGYILNLKRDLVGAATHYRQAIEVNPDYAEAHSNLGNILLEQGELAQAAQHYLRALSIDPDYAEAHNNLGCVVLDQDQLDEAAACFEEALRLKPDYAEAHCNLGVVFKDQNKLDQAMSCFGRAIELKADYPEAWNNQVSILREQNRLDEAKVCCDRALALRPAFAATHCNRGSVLQDQGQLQEAEAEFRLALDLHPGYPEAWYNLVSLKTVRGQDGELSALKTLAADIESVPIRKRPYVYFALAKALNDTGDYARSFEQLLTGNRIKRQSVAYDEAETRENIENIAEVFTADLLNRNQGMGDPTEIPVFVLGMPRSGSTLIEQILSSHRQIHGAGELKLLSAVANSLPGGSAGFPRSFANIDTDILRLLGQAYLRGLPKLLDGKLRITDKMPGNFVYAGLIHLILPRARIIHTMRDPADTCVSCFSKLFTTGSLYSYDLAELGRYYRYYDRLMEHWRSVLPQNTMLDVSYEEVVDDLEGQARRIVQYCGLSWDARCLDFYKNDRAVLTASSVQVRQPLYRSSVNRWRRYQAYLGPLLAELEKEDLSTNAHE